MPSLLHFASMPACMPARLCACAGRTVDGREIMVKFAKYGRNEEIM